MNNAHGIKRTGPAVARGDHLDAANETRPASELWEQCRLSDNNWRYVRSDEKQDVRRTWARFGWVPGMRRGA